MARPVDGLPGTDQGLRMPCSRSERPVPRKVLK